MQEDRSSKTGKMKMNMNDGRKESPASLTDSMQSPSACESAHNHYLRALTLRFPAN